MGRKGLLDEEILHCSTPVYKPVGADDIDFAFSPYWQLEAYLSAAFSQAATGKGKERHATDNAFEEQIICEIQRILTEHCPYAPVGAGYSLGQAIKKLIEAERLPTLAQRQAERYGAINYIAARGIVDAETEETTSG